MLKTRTITYQEAEVWHILGGGGGFEIIRITPLNFQVTHLWWGHLQDQVCLSVCLSVCRHLF